MSHRLQVLIPEELDAKITKAAQRTRASNGAWVRRAIEQALQMKPAIESPGRDPLVRLASLGAPTAAIEDMIAEIESGRS
jgi:hypothetical protein